jgi:dissimilatory sulfite reductase related protein
LVARESSLFPETDTQGFLIHPETWNKAVAEILAREEVPGKLTEEHWKVLDFLREYYLQFDNVPPIRMLCKRTGLKFAYICKLFPSGLVKGAFRIAGIPRDTISPGSFYQ